ncbi:hypothetical protein D9757_004358 [Collybiopsis confluens]|uniref:Uncharacterized protein n=1 Tax=Collybiopsis confluens TaxID=2823264 RepID=A0A8H5HU71_9AGAR|nr:hypothetical protein D9757_004358 [Collybiopsis confluens]
MAAPTQQLPPWFSASVVVVDGQTATTLVYLPLTYFGPSIPLGSLYTFGGSTSPASTSASTTPTSVSLTSSATSSTTATPSTITSSFASSTSVSSSPTSSFTSSPTSSPTSSLTSSSTPSASVTPPSQNHGLARGQLIGVIIASILGFIFLFVLALFLYLWWNARRRRHASDDNTFAAVPLDDEEYVVVGSPGEGSPRASGDEADPFLRREHGMADVQGPVTPVSVPGPGHHFPSADNSLSSNSTSTNSAASGYGTVLANPSLGVFPPFGVENHNRVKGKILSPEQLRQFDNLPPALESRYRLSTVGERGELVALTPPPRLVDPSHSHSRSLDRMPSLGSQISSDAGEATLLTARRVRAEDLGSRPIADSSRKRDSLRGFGLAALGWFQGLGSSSSRRNSQVVTSLQSTRLGDRDVEAGRALLDADTGAPSEMSEVPRFRGQLGLGVGYAGNRPVSGASANSRSSTIYHDAQSSLPGTPLVMPPPRALANSSSAELGYWPPSTTDTSSATAALRFSHDSRTGTQSTSASTDNATTVDILDIPVPRAISPFASANSLREKGTISSVSSQGKTEFSYPPGLSTFSIPQVWNQTTGTTPSPGSFAATSLHSPEEAGISIDVLEEAPPIPGDHWKFLATGHSARRTTFGNPQVSDSLGFDSEQGSLHSMRSYLSPTSRSTGSAAASRREQSGSASSRPSARSAARSFAFSSDGSGASVSHSGSISSDDRRKNRALTMSPTLSAFGSRSQPPSTSGHGQYPSSLGGDESPLRMPSPIPEGPAISSSQGHTSPHSPRSPLSSVPWAAGLDDAWSPS